MDDLISRQAALNAMDTWDKFGCDPDGKLVSYDDDNHYVPYVHYDDMIHVIKHLPSAQPEPRWMKKRRANMTKYSEIEVKTAQNLLKRGFKWIGRNQAGRLSAHAAKPSKVGTYWWSVGYSDCTCDYVPIFQSVTWDDTEPTSIESIVHPQILDDAEKRYLSAVIKPFRESVRSIAKSDIYKDEVICIDTKKRYMAFPPFKAGTMYKGMELNRKYTLEELGL